MSARPAISIEPIVSYPREVKPGKTYMMTVDLRFSVEQEWPYDEEEHEIHCMLDSSPLFDNEELGESVIVLHRFGGTYGPAVFLLTANAVEMDAPTGSITLTLANRQLVPLQVFKLDKIRISKDAEPMEETVNITRAQAPVFSSSSAAGNEAPDLESNAPDLETMAPALPRGIRLQRTINLSRNEVPSIFAIVWSPDGRALALGTGRGVWLLDSETNQPQLRIDTPRFRGCSWSPDGSSLALARERRIAIHDPANGTLRFETPHDFNSDITSMQWAPDGRWLGVTTQGGRVLLLDAERSMQWTGFGPEDDSAWSMAWRLQGDYFLAGFESGKLLLWASRRSVELRYGSSKKANAEPADRNDWVPSARRYKGHRGRVNSVAWSPRGVFFASGSDDQSVRLWRVDEPDENYQIVLEGHTAPVVKVCFSAVGNLLASQSVDSTARIWDVNTHQCLAVLDASAQFSLSFHPTTNVLAMCIRSDDTLSLLDVDSNVLRGRDPIPEVETVKTEEPKADTPKRFRILILYGRYEQDERLAEEIHAALIEEHDSVLVLAEGKWTEVPEVEIRGADCLILLLSAAAVSDNQHTIARQLGFALDAADSGRPKLLTVRVADRSPLPEQLGSYLNGIQWAYWHAPSDTPDLIAQLKRAISESDGPSFSGDVSIGKIFFAYKRDVEPDESVTREIAAALASRHDVFIDRQLQVGTVWADVIAQRFNAARVVIVVLSAESMKSGFVRWYLSAALRRLDSLDAQLRIIPVRLAYESPLPEDLAPLNNFQHVKWNNREDTPRVIEQLLKIIESPDPYAKELPPLGLAVPIGSSFYIERDGDRMALDLIARKGATILIEGPPRTGKTSLVARIRQAAEDGGKPSVYFDVRVLTGELTLYVLMNFICGEVARVAECKDFDQRWATAVDPSIRNVNGAVAKLMEQVLEESNTPVVLAIEGVEDLVEAELSSSFMSILRDWHRFSTRSYAAWNKLDLVLTFSLLSAAFPSETSERPSFGVTIKVEDFTVEQAGQLHRRHGLPLNDAEEARLYALLGGHPYLTQLALHAVGSGRYSAEELFARATDPEGPFREHLQAMRALFYTPKRDDELWRGFFDVLQHSTPDPAARRRLESLGFIRVRDGKFEVRCKLYEEFFRARIAT